VPVKPCLKCALVSSFWWMPRRPSDECLVYGFVSVTVLSAIATGFGLVNCLITSCAADKAWIVAFGTCASLFVLAYCVAYAWHVRQQLAAEQEPRRAPARLRVFHPIPESSAAVRLPRAAVIGSTWNFEPASGDLCIICALTVVSVAMVPCGHVCMCLSCSELSEMERCPVCKQAVTRVMHLFMSGLPP
jgi:hypothetical protein